MMNNLGRAFCAFYFFALAPVAAFAEQQNLRFVDQAGKPLANVIVRYSYTTTPPALPGGTYERVSDMEGRITIAHPCGITSGSCCTLTSPVTYTVLGKFGYSIGGSGSVNCGLSFPPAELTIVGVGQEYPKLAAVSAASYQEGLSNGMIVSAFGVNLATMNATAGLPLPTKLAGRQVFLRDADGVERALQLLFVSPNQINFILTFEGSFVRTLIVRDEDNHVVSGGFLRLAAVSPGIFTANANGLGVPAAVIVRVRADGSQQYEPVNQFDPVSRRFVAIPLDLGPESETIVLALFGTGWRQASSVSVKSGDVECPIDYLGKQPSVEGLDQLNIRLPRALIGKGDVTVQAVFGGFTANPANPVQLKIK